jgi:hypothetical protein
MYENSRPRRIQTASEWSGNWSDFLERQATQLEAVAVGTKYPKLKAWANKVAAQLRDDAAKQRQQGD